MAKPKLLIAQPTAWMREFPTVAQWKVNLVVQIASSRFFDSYMLAFCNKSRIHNSRNAFCNTAIEQGFEWLLFVDPDMHPDLYYDPSKGHKHSEGPVRPFFTSSLSYMLQNPDIGAIAAPACSGPPELNTNLFIRCEGGGATRMPRQEAAVMKPCMCRVAAIGTGLMLIRTSVLKEIKPPFFLDTYNDPREMDVTVGQDCYFCERVIEAGYKVYANMYAWAGHWKDFCIGKPGADGLPLEAFNNPGDEVFIEDIDNSQLEELVDVGCHGKADPAPA